MTKRLNLIMIALLLVPALLCAAAPDDERGWWFSERFQGSSNAAGVVLKANSTAGYTFNEHVRGYIGLPVYFTRESSGNSSTGSSTFVNGIGNAFTGLLVSVNKESLRYSSDVVLTAPTGDRSRGFSTGHVTVDWTNTFSRPFSAFTPYASVGAANTVSDTEFFVRPFTTEGAVVHFEGGALFRVASHLSSGVSAYGVRGAGRQEIVSKVVEVPAAQPAQQSSSSSPKDGVASTVTKTVGLGSNGNGNANSTTFETTHEAVTTAAVANDHGFSTWLSLRPNSMTDFHVGYSRSMAYQLNSVFFGVGFRAGH